MEKKYQVFVSSTYLDLIEERKEVIQALLESDCIPVGMELFPAADDDQWSYITSVIDECDYYLLILAGRYGSCTENGMSYTEKEYRYALEIGKPIIAFVHDDFSIITTGKAEHDPEKISKLNEFKNLVRRKLCKGWKTSYELGGAVGRSLTVLKKRSPATGWIKASSVLNEGSAIEILRLKEENEKLQNEIQAFKASLIIDTSGLSQGESIFQLDFSAGAWNERYTMDVEETFTCEYSWNQIFCLLGTTLLESCSESEIKQRLNEFILKNELENITDSTDFSTVSKIHIAVDQDAFETIIIQFKALGLIRNIHASDNNGERIKWTLTPKGESNLLHLKAIKI